MLEILLPFAGVIGTGGFLLRGRLYEAIYRYEFNKIPTEHKIKLKKLLEEYEDKMPNSKTKNVRFRLHLLDVATGADKVLNERKYLPKPKKMKESNDIQALEAPKETDYYQSLLRKHRINYQSHELIVMSPSSVIGYFEESERKGFIAFLIFVNMSRAKILSYQQHYDLILSEKSSVISNMPLIVESVMKTNSANRIRLTLERTIDPIIQKHQERVSKEADSNIVTFINMLNLDEEVLEELNNLPAPEPEKKVSDSDELDEEAITLQEKLEDLRIYKDSEDFFPTFFLQSTQPSFYMRAEFLLSHVPYLESFTRKSFFDSLCTNMEENGFKIQLILSRSFTKEAKEDVKNSMFIMNYITRTYLPFEKRKNTFLLYDKGALYQIQVPSTYIMKTGLGEQDSIREPRFVKYWNESSGKYEYLD